MFERLIIFGASGDLTSRLLLPSLAEIQAEGLLPEGLEITGVGRIDWSTTEFRAKIAADLETYAPSISKAARRALVQSLRYYRGDLTDANAMRGLLSTVDRPLLAYLALPPNLFEGTLGALAEARLPHGSAIAIEKPFGDGLDSAKRLNALLHAEFPGAMVYRVDHFPSSELVQRISTLRFSNRFFEPVWNAAHVERVEISWDETLTLEGRATYYDRAGAARDMIQNHLLQVLCFVAMEPPARYDERAVRDARANVLAAIPSPSIRQIRAGSLRARYTAGTIGRRAVPAYVDEPGIDPANNTETLAEITVYIDNWRWQGVPFVLRSGKALAKDAAEVAIHFRPAPAMNRGTPPMARNVLRIGLMEPYVRLEINDIGQNRAIEVATLELNAQPPARSPYANLLKDMLAGEPMMMTRGDEAEEMWRIVEPVLDAWAAGKVPLLEYAAGTNGPPTRESQR